MIALFFLFLPFLLPDLDIDRDTWAAKAEHAAGCNPFDRESYPRCPDLDGDGIGEGTPIAPVCAASEGFASCAQA